MKGDNLLVITLLGAIIVTIVFAASIAPAIDEKMGLATPRPATVEVVEVAEVAEVEKTPTIRELWRQACDYFEHAYLGVVDCEQEPWISCFGTSHMWNCLRDMAIAMESEPATPPPTSPPTPEPTPTATSTVAPATPTEPTAESLAIGGVSGRPLLILLGLAVIGAFSIFRGAKKRVLPQR